jgi:hypothetical protein
MQEQTQEQTIPESDPQSKTKKRIFRRRSRIKRSKLKQLNLPDSSINFFEDIELYRKAQQPSNPNSSSRSYHSRRKAQFSK